MKKQNTSLTILKKYTIVCKINQQFYLVEITKEAVAK